MRMFGLTDLGHVIKLEVTDSEDETNTKTKVIENAIVLDTLKATFSLEYAPNKHGDLVTETITENPKDIYDRVSRARNELEKREIAFMTHLFLIEKDDYTVNELKKNSKVSKLRKIKNADQSEDTNSKNDKQSE